MLGIWPLACNIFYNLLFLGLAVQCRLGFDLGWSSMRSFYDALGQVLKVDLGLGRLPLHNVIEGSLKCWNWQKFENLQVPIL